MALPKEKSKKTHPALQKNTGPTSSEISNLKRYILPFSQWLCLGYRNGLTVNAGYFLLGFVCVSGWGIENVGGAEELVNSVDGWQWKNGSTRLERRVVTYL
jgi:hypothetical protein